MNTAVATTRADYLDRVAAGLADLPDDDREEVLQDLRAHLAELDEGDIVTTLGSPEAFVAEFRQSAGLEEKPGRRTRHRIRSTRAKLDVFERRLAEMTHWSTTRQLWIWTRGWLVVSTYAVLTGGTAFQRFPIPVVEGQTAFGLALVATATWLSVWLDGRQTTPRQAVSFVYSAIAVLFVMVSLVSVVDLSRHVVVEPFYSDQLIDSEGVPIVNIYAYDLDGNPVEVLLFDQDGSPLLNLPDWAYHEAEQNPGRTGPIDFGDGAVEFRTDEFGRVIPNLYPLDLYSYGVYGLEPTDPPGLRSTEPEAVDEQGTIVTTTMIGQVD